MLLGISPELIVVVFFLCGEDILLVRSFLILGSADFC